jgi:thiol-disulfide isomerase/thioredoxin
MDQSTCADEESVFRVKVPNYTMYGRRAKIAAIVIGMLATLSTTSTFAQALGQLDTPALDFRAHTLGPHPVTRTLADYRGKVMLLAVWATWCPGCRDEMASMQRMYASYAERGFRVVAVSIDRGSDAEISAFAHSLIRRRNFAAVDWDVEPRLGQIRSLLDEPEPPATSAVKK